MSKVPSAEDIMKANTPVMPPVQQSNVKPVEIPFINTAEMSVDDQLKHLQLKQLQKQVGEQEETESVQRAARIANAKSMDEGRKKQEQLQGLCPHVKPNGRTAIGGQRDHSNNYILICAYCQKLFNERTIPPMLRPSPETVGGPLV